MMSSSTEDYQNDYDNDRLVEIAMSVPKMSILLFPVVGRRRNRPGQFLRCGRGRKLRFAVGISVISVILSDI